MSSIGINTLLDSTTDTGCYTPHKFRIAFNLINISSDDFLEMRNVPNVPLGVNLVLEVTPEEEI